MADRGKTRTKELQSAIESIQRGEFGKAEKILLQITASDPKNFNANHMLGIVSTELNKFEQAEKFFKTSLAINATNLSVYKNYGFFLTKAKQFDRAIEQFDIALRLSPNFALAYSDRGNALEKLDKLDEAIADYNRAITLDPGIFGFYNNRGGAFLRKNRHSEALSDFKRAIELNPNFADAHCGYGNVLVDLKLYEEALAAYQNALSLEPDLENAWLGRGNALVGLQRYDDALTSYETALSLKPDLEQALVGRGHALLGLKRYDDALATYDQALSLKPDLENAWLGRGNVFRDLKRFDDAFAAYGKAVALEPDFAQAHYNEGFLRLSLGQMELGWRKCEYRWETQQFRDNKRNFSQPLWLGDNDINGKTILLHAEQGLGDTVLACRYITNVAALGAKVILEVQSTLKSLLMGLDGVSMLIGRGDAIPHFDVQCPLMSLPLAFAATIETIPSTVPYITVPKDAVKKWRAKLSAQKLKVGIAWAGNPDFGGDRDRSILLKNILPVTRIDGIEFFSLQKDLREGDEEVLNANPGIVRVDDEINDFRDTAAIMMGLDLVISSDTSVVNLAGALGRPVWVLLSSMPDWRWLLDRNDSPWYPTARLFRQVNAGDWTTVLDDVCAALKQFARSDVKAADVQVLRHRG
jgi:tetratricopeptide (TPR) repeat protein